MEAYHLEPKYRAFLVRKNEEKVVELQYSNRQSIYILGIFFCMWHFFLYSVQVLLFVHTAVLGPRLSRKTYDI